MSRSAPAPSALRLESLTVRRRLKAPGPIGFTGVINPGAVTRPSCCKREVFAGLDPIVLKQAVQSSKIAAMPDSDAWEEDINKVFSDRDKLY